MNGWSVTLFIANLFRMSKNCELICIFIYVSQRHIFAFPLDMLFGSFFFCFSRSLGQFHSYFFCLHFFLLFLNSAHYAPAALLFSSTHISGRKDFHRFDFFFIIFIAVVRMRWQVLNLYLSTHDTVIMSMNSDWSKWQQQKKKRFVFFSIQ